MNLWGFARVDARGARRRPRRLRSRDGAARGRQAARLLLPDVVGQAVAAGRARIRVVPSNSRCIGLTHPGDLPLVRQLVAEGLTG